MSMILKSYKIIENLTCNYGIVIVMVFFFFFLPAKVVEDLVLGYYLICNLGEELCEMYYR